MRVGVLYLIDRLAVGGTEGQLRELVQGLDRERFQPHVGTLRASDTGENFPDVPRLSLQFKALPHPTTFRCLWQLSAYVRRNGIRIVQTFFQDPTALAALSRPLLPALLIGSFRDLGFWRNGKESLKMRLAYPAFSGFIANSKAVKDNFSAIDRVPAEKIEVIYNGISIDDAISTKEPLLFEKNTPLVGIVANLNREVKRVQDFVQAAAVVRKHNPEARFVIIGDGHLRSQLENLGHSLGLAGVLKFAGQLKQPFGLVRHFAVGVNTSETEGFSNAILEYMAFGIPVVATNAGGTPELVREGVNGFLVPVGEVELMAERIVTLLRHDDLRNRMSLSNLQQVKSRFSLERMVQSHENYYERLLAK
jgi:glycosyltransferase involved in cell wall biosynthesis